MRKKLLALLLAAALALSLLAGCGGGESAASALLKLLDGRYPNISIEIDPELEADLRQAIRKAEAENAGDDAAVIRAALETALGSTITFRYLGDGQKGETAFDLVFYAGSDPDKAAQAAYSQWDPILSNVPADGKYDTSLAMVETNSGVWMLVKATVEKAGRPDKDDEPDPVTLKSLSVTGPSQTEYIKGQTFDSAGMTVTAYYSDGSFKPIAAGEYTIVIDDKEVSSSYQFDQVGPHTLKVKYNEMVSTNSVSIWVADENGYHEEGSTYVVTGSNGLQNLFSAYKAEAASAAITLNSSVTLDENWNGENITFSGTLNGNGNTITLTENRTQGLFNEISWGTVENVHLQINGTIKDGTGYIGGIAGTLGSGGTIKGCSVTGGSISGTSFVGGVVGQNYDGTVTACYHRGSVSTSGDLYSIAGGVVGWNDGSVTACYHAGSVSGDDAGGVVGCNNDGTVTACYWSGTAVSANGSHSNHGIGIDQTGESHNDNANQVTADGKVDPTAGIVNWNTALAGLNGQSTGYTFGGEDMNNPTLTKIP